VAERIRLCLKGRALPHAHSDAARVVTVSLGVASTLPSPDQDAGLLLKRADDNLYEAKRQGRNQAVGR
jgi:diguanylate cyclase (GGDEF)-like protein